MSQNWVCRSWPPGALKQHVLATALVFWQLICAFGQLGGLPPRARGPLYGESMANWEVKARLANDRRATASEGILNDVSTQPSTRDRVDLFLCGWGWLSEVSISSAMCAYANFYWMRRPLRCSSLTSCVLGSCCRREAMLLKRAGRQARQRPDRIRWTFQHKG